MKSDVGMNVPILSYDFNIELLAHKGNRCIRCGSEHQFGNVEQFNRYFFIDQKFSCNCPSCIQQWFPYKYSTDDIRLMLLGLDNNQLQKYIVNNTPEGFINLCNPYDTQF